MKQRNLVSIAVLIGSLSAGIFLYGCNSTINKVSEKSGHTKKSITDFLLAPEGNSNIINRKFEQVPAIAADADGNVIYVAWYSGGLTPGSGNFVTVSTSIDNGISWANDQLVVYSKKSTIRIFDPALWRDQNGQVHLFYGSVKDSIIWDGYGGVNSVEIGWDGSKMTWNAPKRLSNGVMSNMPIYIDSKKLTLLPVYIDKPADNNTGLTYPLTGAFILSQDKKLTIAPYSSIKLPDSIRIHDEPQIVEISGNGEFLVLLRTTKGIYFANSYDYGKSWTEPKPFTASGPTTSSRFYIGKLASGNLLLDGNIHVVFDRDRTGAMIFFTEDSLKMIC